MVSALDGLGMAGFNPIPEMVQLFVAVAYLPAEDVGLVVDDYILGNSGKNAGAVEHIACAQQVEQMTVSLLAAELGMGDGTKVLGLVEDLNRQNVLALVGFHVFHNLLRIEGCGSVIGDNQVDIGIILLQNTIQRFEVMRFIRIGDNRNGYQ